MVATRETEPPLTSEREAELIKREEDVKATIAAVKVLVAAMGQRVLTVMALLAGIAAFGCTIYEPTPIRITAVVLYACLIFLPLAVIDARRG